MVPVFVQVPVESHVCGWFGLRGVHCLAPGVQTPAHAPATQEKGQAEITHAPDGLHVCTDVPTQPVVPGVQMAGPASGLAKSTVMAAVGAGFTTRVIAGVPSNDDADAPMRAHVRNVRRAAASSRSPVARHQGQRAVFRWHGPGSGAGVEPRAHLAGPYQQLSGVAHPALVGPLGRELAVQNVGCNLIVVHLWRRRTRALSPSPW